jgi:periplasmic divalent cation tolerance protein
MVVLVTVPNRETGEKLAREVVEDRLAACGNILPGVTSVYRWEGETHQDPECLIIFKTTKASLASLKEKVMELHPYDVPEFLALPVSDGHLPYLRWVQGETSGNEES